MHKRLNQAFVKKYFCLNIITALLYNSNHSYDQNYSKTSHHSLKHLIPSKKNFWKYNRQRIN